MDGLTDDVDDNLKGLELLTPFLISDQRVIICLLHSSIQIYFFDKFTRVD
jgi:hypothetical protein